MYNFIWQASFLIWHAFYFCMWFVRMENGECAMYYPHTRPHRAPVQGAQSAKRLRLVAGMYTNGADLELLNAQGSRLKAKAKACLPCNEGLACA